MAFSDTGPQQSVPSFRPDLYGECDMTTEWTTKRELDRNLAGLPAHVRTLLKLDSVSPQTEDTYTGGRTEARTRVEAQRALHDLDAHLYYYLLAQFSLVGQWRERSCTSEEISREIQIYMEELWSEGHAPLRSGESLAVEYEEMNHEMERLDFKLDRKLASLRKKIDELEKHEANNRRDDREEAKKCERGLWRDITLFLGLLPELPPGEHGSYVKGFRYSIDVKRLRGNQDRAENVFLLSATKGSKTASAEKIRGYTDDGWFGEEVEGKRNALLPAQKRISDLLETARAIERSMAFIKTNIPEEELVHLWLGPWMSVAINVTDEVIQDAILDGIAQWEERHDSKTPSPLQPSPQQNGEKEKISKRIEALLPTFQKNIRDSILVINRADGPERIRPTVQHVQTLLRSFLRMMEKSG